MLINILLAVNFQSKFILIIDNIIRINNYLFVSICNDDINILIFTQKKKHYYNDMPCIACIPKNKRFNFTEWFHHCLSNLLRIQERLQTATTLFSLLLFVMSGKQHLITKHYLYILYILLSFMFDMNRRVQDVSESEPSQRT